MELQWNITHPSNEDSSGTCGGMFLGDDRRHFRIVSMWPDRILGKSCMTNNQSRQNTLVFIFHKRKGQGAISFPNTLNNKNYMIQCIQHTQAVRHPHHNDHIRWYFSRSKTWPSRMCRYKIKPCVVHSTVISICCRLHWALPCSYQPYHPMALLKYTTVQQLL